jgi:hypothetical protein
MYERFLREQALVENKAWIEPNKDEPADVEIKVEEKEKEDVGEQADQEVSQQPPHDV